MQTVKLPKENLDKFVKNLGKFGQIYAPIKKDANTYLFSKIEDCSKIDLGYNRTVLPPKKYFLPPIDTMFRFSAEAGYQEVEHGLDKKSVLLRVTPAIFISHT